MIVTDDHVNGGGGGGGGSGQYVFFDYNVIPSSVLNIGVNIGKGGAGGTSGPVSGETNVSSKNLIKISWSIIGYAGGQGGPGVYTQLILPGTTTITATGGAGGGLGIQGYGTDTNTQTVAVNGTAGLKGAGGTGPVGTIITKSDEGNGNTHIAGRGGIPYTGIIYGNGGSGRNGVLYNSTNHYALAGGAGIPGNSGAVYVYYLRN